jgi:hypothetical protein
MRSVFYVTVLACLLSGLLVFAAAPAVAQMMSNQMMQKSGPTVEHQVPTAGPTEMGFSGEAKAGASQGMGVHSQMKTMMKSETTGKASQPSETKGPVGAQPANVSAQAKGGEATVAREDRPGNCLHVRSDPSASSKEIACVPKGQKVHLTGVFTRNGRWAQLDNHGWVFFRQLKTNVRPPLTASTEMSWGQSAAAGKTKPHARRHHYRGFRHCYPGYYYYYPGYYYGWY